MTDVGEPEEQAWIELGPDDQPEIQLQLEAAEPFDGRLLDLTDAEIVAIEGLSDLAERFGRYGIRHGLFRSRRSESPEAGFLSAMLGAAAGVVQSGIRPCPYAPFGVAVEVVYRSDYSPILRCRHTPAHCWNGLGQAPYQC